ncbi:MAG: hypothetical protein WCF57_14720, partial [Pyrinomonadaceae bacterium]
RRLTRLAGIDGAHAEREDAILSLGMWACPGVFLIAIALAGANARVLATMHAMIEHVVWALQ